MIMIMNMIMISSSSSSSSIVVFNKKKIHLSVNVLCTAVLIECAVKTETSVSNVTSTC